MANLREFLEKHRDLLQIHIESEQLGVIEEDLFSQLYFSEDDIAEHIECQAAAVAWWGVVCRVAESEYARLQHDYDMWHIPLYEREYERLWAELGYARSNKPNISSVENAVKLARKRMYSEWQRRLREAKKQVAILKDVLRWWEEKGQMLVQAAKYITAEMNFTDFHVRKEEKAIKQLRGQMDSKY